MTRKLGFVERTLRRTKVYGGRLRRTVAGPAPRRRSVFIHLPKCGGTSIAEAMYATVPIHERIGVIDAPSTRRAVAIMHEGRDDERARHEDLEGAAPLFAFRETLLLQHMAWDSWLIHGHVLCSDRAERHFPGKYAHVTIMRDPVARTVSNYRMAAANGVIPADFEAYLDGPVARRHATVNLRYLGGVAEPAGDPAHLLAVAKARIARFDLIGFLDDLEDFRRRYGEIFGVGLAIGRRNEAKGEPVTLDRRQRARMEALCAEDIELFEAARARRLPSAAHPAIPLGAVRVP